MRLKKTQCFECEFSEHEKLFHVPLNWVYQKEAQMSLIIL